MSNHVFAAVVRQYRSLIPHHGILVLMHIHLVMAFSSEAQHALVIGIAQSHVIYTITWMILLRAY